MVMNDDWNKQNQQNGDNADSDQSYFSTAASDVFDYSIQLLW